MFRALSTPWQSRLWEVEHECPSLNNNKERKKHQRTNYLNQAKLNRSRNTYEEQNYCRQRKNIIYLHYLLEP